MSDNAINIVKRIRNFCWKWITKGLKIIVGGVVSWVIIEYFVGPFVVKKFFDKPMELKISSKEIFSSDQGIKIDTIYPALYQHHNHYDNLKIGINCTQEGDYTVIINLDPFKGNRNLLNETCKISKGDSILKFGLQFDESILKVGWNSNPIPKKLIIDIESRGAETIRSSATLGLRFKDHNRFDLNDWSSIVSFVTIHDGDIRNLARKICEFSPDTFSAEKQLKFAIILLNSLKTLGLTSSDTLVDSDKVRFPREILHMVTLGSRKFSSRDLAVLYATLLECVNIPAGLAKVKKDFLVLVKIQGRQPFVASGTSGLFTLTIPVDLCNFNDRSSFNDAWTKGSQKIYGYDTLQTIDIRFAQVKYPPAKSDALGEWKEDIRQLLDSSKQIADFKANLGLELQRAQQKLQESLGIRERQERESTASQQRPATPQQPVTDSTVNIIIELLRTKGYSRLQGVGQLSTLDCNRANNPDLLEICRKILQDPLEDVEFVRNPIQTFLRRCGFSESSK